MPFVEGKFTGAATTEYSALWSKLDIRTELQKLASMDRGIATNKRSRNDDAEDIAYIEKYKLGRMSKVAKPNPPDTPSFVFVIPSGRIQLRRRGAPRPFNDLYESQIEAFRHRVSACYPICYIVCCTECRAPPQDVSICRATSSDHESHQQRVNLRKLLSSGSKGVASSDQRHSPVAISPQKGDRVAKKKVLSTSVASWSINTPYQTLLRGWKNPEFRNHVKEVSSTPQLPGSPLEGINFQTKSSIWRRLGDVGLPGMPVLVPDPILLVPSSSLVLIPDAPAGEGPSVKSRRASVSSDASSDITLVDAPADVGEGSSEKSRRASVSSNASSDISSIDEETLKNTPADLTDDRGGYRAKVISTSENLATILSCQSSLDKHAAASSLPSFRSKGDNVSPLARSSLASSPSPAKLPETKTTTIRDVQCALDKFEALASPMSRTRESDSSDMPLSSFLALFEGRVLNEPSTPATSWRSEGECESESDDSSPDSSLDSLMDFAPDLSDSHADSSADSPTHAKDSSDTKIITNALNSFHLSPVPMDDVDEFDEINDADEFELASTPTEIQLLPAITTVESSTNAMVATADSADESESALSDALVVSSAPMSPPRRLVEILVLPWTTTFQPVASFVAGPHHSMALGVYAPAWYFLQRSMASKMVALPSDTLTIDTVDTVELLSLILMDSLLSLVMRLSLPFPLTSTVERIDASSSVLLSSDTVTSNIESSASMELDSSSPLTTSLDGDSAIVPSPPNSTAVSEDMLPTETAFIIIPPTISTVPSMSTSFIPSTLGRSVYIERFGASQSLLTYINNAVDKCDDQSIDD